jgi:hypothetical protein
MNTTLDFSPEAAASAGAATSSVPTLGGDHVVRCSTCNKSMYGTCQACGCCMMHCACDGRMPAPYSAEEFNRMQTAYIFAGSYRE